MTTSAGDLDRDEDALLHRALYDEAPCGYLSKATDGTVLRANATLLRWLGRPADSPIGSTRFAELLTPGSRVMWQTHHLPRLEQRGHINAVAVELVRSDGSTLPVLVSGVVVRRGGSGDLVVRLTLVDASERRAYERELLAARTAAESAEWRVRAIQQVTEACARATTPEELGGAVVAALTEGLEGSGAVLWEPDSEGSALVRVAGYEAGETLPWATVPLDGPSAPAQVWQSGSPRYVDLLANDPPLSVEDVAALHRTETAGLIVIPSSYAGETLGVLAVCVPPTWRGGPGDVEAFALLGPIVGQAVARTRMHETLRHLALHDTLTGLPNRALLLDRLEQAVLAAERYGHGVGVLVLDLDDFKSLNDRRGHAAGDQALVACAERLLATVRASDTVSRIGGDEFVVVCEGVEAAELAAIAARVGVAVEEPILVDGEPVRLGVSIGTAWRIPPFAPGIVDGLLRAADAAMYEQKRSRSAPR